MSIRVDLYDNIYGHFTDPVQRAIRLATFGTDIGQNSWITVDEYDRLLPWLNAASGRHVLEVASGSGGPAHHLAHTTGCRLTGIDANPGAVATATELAARSGIADRLQFRVASADSPLPFADNTFDALICMDSMNHFADRPAVLREWQRVLKPGGRALFTDPVVITGPVTNEELAQRSSVGFFLYVPPGVNEAFITEAGLRIIRQEDVTANAALIADRWHAARLAHREALLPIEGAERFDGLQRFFDAVRTLTGERRLSRIAYVAEKTAV